jgi:hypothetical protein
VADLAADVKQDTGLRKAIIAGIVSGIIVLVFIQPILGFFWHFFLSNVKSLNDVACREAAVGYVDRNAFLTQTLIFSLMFGGITGLFVGSLLMKRRSVANQVADVIPYRLRILVILALVVEMVVVTVMLGEQYLELKLNASFHQRLTVLAPKISDQEYKEFLASWAAMNSGEDYRHIVEKMETEATTKGITLPKLLRGATPPS